MTTIDKVKITVSSVIALIIVIIFFSSFTIVGAGERGVVLNWGAFQGQIMQPGLNFKIPIAQSVAKIDVQAQKIEILKSEAYSHDLQVVDIHSVVNYNIDPNASGDVYKLYGMSYESTILNARVEASVKQTIAKYTAEELLAKRSEVSGQIEQAIKDTFPTEFVNIRYQLSNEAFSAAFETAIEAKQVSAQQAEQAKNLLAKAQVDAQSTIAKAQGDAEAIKISAEAINSQGGADYVQLQAIKQWDGHLPTNMIPGGAVPFLNLTK